MPSRWSLENKTALVTGSTKGIGYAIAKELLDLGCRVIINSRKIDEVNQVVQEFNSSYPGKVKGKAIDVSNQSQIQKLVEVVEEEFEGKLDILINNVGTNIRKPTIAYSDEEYRTLMAINLDSAFKISQLCYPALKKAENSSLVFISSVSGLTCTSSGSIYSMTKSALIGLTRNLACEWAKDGIRVNCVAPWYVDTPLAQPVLSQPNNVERIVARTPQGRIGKPEEISGPVAFLCMQPASWLTGQTITVDGGFTAFGY